ncbi:MAG: hypothetical protein K6G09_02935 [Treponema sp.]|nr:hypothetical protein [Treponema sp.]
MATVVLGLTEIREERPWSVEIETEDDSQELDCESFFENTVIGYYGHCPFSSNENQISFYYYHRKPVSVGLRLYTNNAAEKPVYPVVFSADSTGGITDLLNENIEALSLSDKQDGWICVSVNLKRKLAAGELIFFGIFSEFSTPLIEFDYGRIEFSNDIEDAIFENSITDEIDESAITDYLTELQFAEFYSREDLAPLLYITYGKLSFNYVVNLIDEQTLRDLKIITGRRFSYFIKSSLSLWETLLNKFREELNVARLFCPVNFEIELGVRTMNRIYKGVTKLRVMLTAKNNLTGCDSVELCCIKPDGTFTRLPAIIQNYEKGKIFYDVRTANDFDQSGWWIIWAEFVVDDSNTSCSRSYKVYVYEPGQ